MEKERTYIAIDLKSFYASVECVERHFDPLSTNLVVADPTRTEKTISASLRYFKHFRILSLKNCSLSSLSLNTANGRLSHLA